MEERDQRGSESFSYDSVPKNDSAPFPLTTLDSTALFDAFEWLLEPAQPVALFSDGFEGNWREPKASKPLASVSPHGSKTSPGKAGALCGARRCSVACSKA